MLKALFAKFRKFKSGNYWEERYKQGGNSGAGSYAHLADFKAEVINAVLEKSGIETVIEFGCGDGNQLSLLNCKKYTGLDVSPTVLNLCREKFKGDQSKTFVLYEEAMSAANKEKYLSDASMSLDVLYHLVEEDVYKKYLSDLFSSAKKLVIIYGADMDLPQQTPHELYRKFSTYIETHFKEWKLVEAIKNKYPAKNYEDQFGSLADFFIYAKK